MAVEHGDEARVARQRRQQPFDRRGRAIDGARGAAAIALRGQPVGVQAVGRGQHQQAGAGEVLRHALVRGDRLGRDRAHADDGDVGAGFRRRVPVAAVDDVGLLLGASACAAGCARLRVESRR